MAKKRKPLGSPVATHAAALQRIEGAVKQSVRQFGHWANYKDCEPMESELRFLERSLGEALAHADALAPQERAPVDRIGRTVLGAREKFKARCVVGPRR